LDLQSFQPLQDLSCTMGIGMPFLYQYRCRLPDFRMGYGAVNRSEYRKSLSENEIFDSATVIPGRINGRDGD
ncbi:MAG: hypothetical protein ACU841_10225, partial [Gammaproteobacteria bacterium]